MAKKPTNPLRPEVGHRYRLRGGYLGGERIADVIEIDSRRGLIYARDVLGLGEVFRWDRAMWRRDCVERIER